MTKRELNQLDMPELWKICAKFGIRRGKRDKKSTIINKIVRNLGGDSVGGEDLAGDSVGGEDLAGEMTFTLSGYDFLNSLLKMRKINLRKMYEQPASLERRKEKGSYNMFFITKSRKVAEKVISDINDVKSFKRTTRTKISDGSFFSRAEYRTSASYKIPFQSLSNKEVKRIVEFVRKND